MKKSNIKEIREKSLEQLYKDLKSLNGELRELRFKLFNREISDVARKRIVKKEIAKIMTIIREKEYKQLLERENTK